MVAYVRSNLIAVLALLVALGGTSYAAVSLPKNSVGSKQVKNGSLKKKDFKAGQLPAGPVGPAGPAGPVGPAWGTFFNGSGSGDPAPTPDGSGSMKAFSLPVSGPVLVWLAPKVALVCTAGTAHVGLYVDGAPVPGTRRTLESGLEIRAIVDLTAGEHTAAVRGDCPSGSPESSGASTNEWLFLALGSTG